tara:strand:+ start:4285 stop:4530 length:246 start_codon:yes stop_codon:yes gene_type:complete
MNSIIHKVNTNFTHNVVSPNIKEPIPTEAQIFEGIGKGKKEIKVHKTNNNKTNKPKKVHKTNNKKDNKKVKKDKVVVLKGY